MKSVEYDDLLRLEHGKDSVNPSDGSINCFGVVFEVLRRMDRWSQLGIEDGAKNLYQYIGPLVKEDSPFKQIGCTGGEATRLGDVILTSNNPRPGLWIVVNEHARLALTATPKFGVVAMCPRRIPQVVGVYRLR